MAGVGRAGYNNQGYDRSQGQAAGWRPADGPFNVGFSFGDASNQSQSPWLLSHNGNRGHPGNFEHNGQHVHYTGRGGRRGGRFPGYRYHGAKHDRGHNRKYDGERHDDGSADDNTEGIEKTLPSGLPLGKITQGRVENYFLDEGYGYITLLDAPPKCPRVYINHQEIQGPCEDSNQKSLGEGEIVVFKLLKNVTRDGYERLRAVDAYPPEGQKFRGSPFVLNEQNADYHVHPPPPRPRRVHRDSADIHQVEPQSQKNTKKASPEKEDPFVTATSSSDASEQNTEYPPLTSVSQSKKSGSTSYKLKKKDKKKNKRPLMPASLETDQPTGLDTSKSEVKNENKEQEAPENENKEQEPSESENKEQEPLDNENKKQKLSENENEEPKSSENQQGGKKKKKNRNKKRELSAESQKLYQDLFAPAKEEKKSAPQIYTSFLGGQAFHSILKLVPVENLSQNVATTPVSPVELVGSDTDASSVTTNETVSDEKNNAVLEPILEEERTLLEVVPENEEKTVVEPEKEEKNKTVLEPVPEKEEKIVVVPAPEKEEKIVVEPVPEKEEKTVLEPEKVEETVVEPGSEKLEKTVVVPAPKKEEKIVVEPVPEKDEKTVVEPVPEKEEKIVVVPAPEKEEKTVLEPEKAEKTVVEPVSEKVEKTIVEPFPEKEEKPVLVPAPDPEEKRKTVLELVLEKEEKEILKPIPEIEEKTVLEPVSGKEDFTTTDEGENPGSVKEDMKKEQ